MDFRAFSNDIDWILLKDLSKVAFIVRDFDLIGISPVENEFDLVFLIELLKHLRVVNGGNSVSRIFLISVIGLEFFVNWVHFEAKRCMSDTQTEWSSWLFWCGDLVSKEQLCILLENDDIVESIFEVWMILTFSAILLCLRASKFNCFVQFTEIQRGFAMSLVENVGDRKWNFILISVWRWIFFLRAEAAGKSFKILVRNSHFVF